jgi:hypothetical protein
VDNFLGYPVGGTVPTGYYDRQEGEWRPSLNGRVITIVALQLGKALVDTDGDGLFEERPRHRRPEPRVSRATRASGDEL